MRPRSPYEGFVHNAYEVSFLIELPGGDLADLDSFASSYYAGYDGNYKAQLLLIWATVGSGAAVAFRNATQVKTHEIP